MYLGGSTVGSIRKMIALAVKLEEFTKKYKLGGVESPERKYITDILGRIVNLTDQDVSAMKLKPLRDLGIERDETEEQVRERMMRLDVRDDDDVEKDWIKLYTTYVKAKDEGKVDETPLQVS